MRLFSFFAAAWIGLLSFLGLAHPLPAAAPSSTTATTSTPIAVTASSTTSMPPATSSPQAANSSLTGTNGSSAATVPTTAAVSDLPATGSPWQTTLPLGDYKYVTAGPKKGYVYLCNVAQGGQGAQGNPPWIGSTTWNLNEKTSVEGSVSWPNATYSMTVSDGMRMITSNDLPTDHPTGIFPIQSTDPAYEYDENPNSIEAQNLSFSLPASPTPDAAGPQCIYGEVGVMNDGVLLLDSFDAEYRDALAHEMQDAWDGHPHQGGMYHYHGFEDSVMKDTPVSTVVGFAFDGYPITGGLLPDGTYLTTSDLDECHGVTSTITLDGKSVTTYHYVLTQDFPYTVSCFHGKSYEPAPTVMTTNTGSMNGSMNGMEGMSGMSSSGSTGSGGTPPTPPQAAITACANASANAACSFSGQNGATVSGTCGTPPGQSSLACVPN